MSLVFLYVTREDTLCVQGVLLIDVLGFGREAEACMP